MSADMDGLSESAALSNNGGAFVLFCEDETGENIAEGASAARKWVLLSWVPDLCR